MQAKHCRKCGENLQGKGEYYSDRCFCYAHRHALPFNRASLRAWDSGMIPIVFKGQQNAFGLNRPCWHGRVFGGSQAHARPVAGLPGGEEGRVGP